MAARKKAKKNRHGSGRIFNHRVDDVLHLRHKDNDTKNMGSL